MLPRPLSQTQVAPNPRHINPMWAPHALMALPSLTPYPHGHPIHTHNGRHGHPRHPQYATASPLLWIWYPQALPNDLAKQAYPSQTLGGIFFDMGFRVREERARMSRPDSAAGSAWACMPVGFLYLRQAPLNRLDTSCEYTLDV